MVADVLETQAVLISNPHCEHPDLVEKVRRRIDGYITATKYVMIIYNVSNNLLDAAIKITPGKRSPTITPLEDVNVKAVSSLVLKNEISATMDALHDIGATDILAVNLMNSRM